MHLNFTIPSRGWRPILLGGLLATAVGASHSATAQRVLWADAPQVSASLRVQTGQLGQHRSIAIQPQALQQVLATAPAPAPTAARNSATVISLPMPDGTSARFRVAEVSVMAPGLAARYPGIKTYEAQGIDDPTATARLDFSPEGFHAMIVSPTRTVFIDPATRGDNVHHLVFDRTQMRRLDNWTCLNTDAQGVSIDVPARLPNGNLLRTYRLALACTGEYSVAVAGPNPTKAAVLAKMVTSVNRVDGVYRQEVSVAFSLLANTDALIYLDGATDPYTNSSGSAMLGENQTTINSIIGAANYDIGHVFSTGGGGVAYLRSVCASNKAGGVTGSPNPQGDAFDIDYVAHEVGHQFGGNHTFNGNLGSCAGGNRSNANAYEPGSGTTIMAYAGICGANNLQPNSDPYFHSRSLDEITAHITGAGNCSVNTPNGNLAPVANAGANYRIPLNTPFTLTGSATDADGDALVYDWEQYNLGAAGAPAAPVGDAPIFRFFPPTSNPSRTFPKLSDIVNNTSTIGEILPTYARRLIFRFVARDNRIGGGGVDYDSMTVAAIANTGPFLVTYPNASNTTLYKGITQTITWDVANTNVAPISATNVRITLSTDGGLTYPTVLAASTPNDGSESISIPSTVANTTTARVKIEAVGNVFFDISNNNFAIETITEPTFFLSATSPSATVCSYTAPVTVTVSTSTALGFTGPVTLTATNLPTGVTATFSPNPVQAGSSAQLTLTATTAAVAGSRTITITGTSGTITRSQSISFNVCAQPTAPNAPNALTALAGSGPGRVDLFWLDNSTDETGFRIERSTSATTGFQVVATVAANVTFYTDQVPFSGTYYYRVQSFNTAGGSAYSNAEPITIIVTSNQNSAALKGVSVYPNPSLGKFQVQVENAQRGVVALRVSDGLGRTVISQSLTKSAATLNHALDLTHLKAGVYQLHLDLPDGSAVTRIIKQ